MALIAGSRGPEIHNASGMAIEEAGSMNGALELDIVEQGLTSAKIREIHDRGYNLVRSNIRPNGIVASGDDGCFANPFDRDAAITTRMAIANDQLPTQRIDLSMDLAAALDATDPYQGRQNNPATGEEYGKRAHESHQDVAEILQFKARLDAGGGTPWYEREEDGHIVCWDSADATSLWLIAKSEWYGMSGDEPSPDALERIRAAAIWHLNTISQYGGFIGFTSATEQPGRKYGGLINMSWKDSWNAYLNERGGIAKHPIHDILVNAGAFAALGHAAKWIEKTDPALAQLCRHEARALKARFNTEEHGFLRRENGGWFFAEALDGNLEQLPAVSSDVIVSLGMFVDGETIIEERYIDDVIVRSMEPDILNRGAGLRTYASGVTTVGEDPYHRGDGIVWGNQGGTTVMGLQNLGRTREALEFAIANLSGSAQFETPVEVKVEQPDGTLDIWRNVKEKREANRNQTWDGMAEAYLANYMQANAA